MRYLRIVSTSALLLAIVLSATAATPAVDSSPVLGSLAKQFYVVSEGDKSAAITLSVAEEVRKSFDPMGSAVRPWVVPEPSWSTDDLVKRCADPDTLGGVVFVYSSGYATHFYLLWQSETSTLIVNAIVIACGTPAPTAGLAKPSATIVAVIGETPGANGTPWIVRASEVSIPLITVAGIGTLVTKNAASSKTGTTNLTFATIAGAIFTQASNRDIPGYSDPVRLRHAAQHIGVDFVGSMKTLCAKPADLASAEAIAARAKFCVSIGYPTQ
jgi:hypothetical protein